MPTTDAKLGDRRTYLGASEVAAALGYSPWTTREDLWAYKTGRRPGKVQTPQMRRGHDMEPIIAKIYQEKTGRALTAEQVEYSHPDLPWFKYHADGTTVRVVDNAAEEGLLEFKAPDPDVVRGYLDCGLPDDYIFQINAGMLLAQRQWIGVAVYDYRQHTVHSFDVTATSGFQQAILAGVEEFWHYVQRDVRPPAMVPRIEVPSVSGDLVNFDADVYVQMADLFVSSRADKLLAIANEEKVVAELQRVMEAHGAGLAQFGRNLRISWKHSAGRTVLEAGELMEWTKEIVADLVGGEVEAAMARAARFDEGNFKKKTPTRPFIPTFYGEAKKEVESAGK